MSVIEVKNLGVQFETQDGTVYAVTVIRKKDRAENYNVVLVDLDEGPRLMSRVDGIDHDAITIGMKVSAQIIAEGDKPLLVFAPL